MALSLLSLGVAGCHACCLLLVVVALACLGLVGGYVDDALGNARIDFIKIPAVHYQELQINVHQ